MRRALFFLLTACTSTTSDDFQNPPPPPPSTCAADSTVAGCTAGSVGYTCTSDRPDDGDTNLVCSAGRPAPGGTSYCCLPYGQHFSDCTNAVVTGCADPGFAFSCSGAAIPSDVDSRLACSSADAGAYCCVSSVAPSCVADRAVACTGASAGFACTGASPGANDAPVACAPVGSSEDGATTYCCVPFLQAPSTCEEDDRAGCPSGTFGFTCSGLHRPEENNTGLSCTAAPLAGGYCCTLESPLR